MSLTLQKLSQIRKKMKDKEESLQTGNYYDPEDAETSPSIQDCAISGMNICG